MTAPRPDQGLGDGAEITADDIERAKLAWQRSAPPQFKHLLDAELDKPKGTS